MNSSALWAIVGIIVLGGVGFWLYSAQAPTPATNVQVETPAPTDTNTQGTGGTSGVGASAGAGVDVGIGDASAPAASASVSYGANGFSPATITVKAGTRVTWTNTGSGRMWVGADEHPSHTGYDGTDRASHCAPTYTGPTPFDQCASGNTYSFVFTKAGTYDYHNHSNAAHTGRVVVQ